MATYAWPSWIRLSGAEFALQKAAAISVSPFNGSIEPYDYVAERWRFGLRMPPAATLGGDAYRRAAFFNRISGAIHRVVIGPYLWGQYVPAGTMRGSPTLAAAAVRGSDMLQVTGSGSLKMGDWISAGPQLFQVADDCSSAGGTIYIPLVNRVRANIAAGTAVVWNQPTGQFIVPAASISAVLRAGIAEEVFIDALEIWGMLVLNTETGDTLFTETGDPIIVL